MGPGGGRGHDRLRRSGVDRAGQPREDALCVQPLDLAVRAGGRRHLRLRHGAVVRLHEQGAGARGRRQPEIAGRRAGGGHRGVRHPQGRDSGVAHADGGPHRPRVRHAGHAARLGGPGLRGRRSASPASCSAWRSAARWWPGHWQSREFRAANNVLAGAGVGATVLDDVVDQRPPGLCAGAPRDAGGSVPRHQFHARPRPSASSRPSRTRWTG